MSDRKRRRIVHRLKAGESLIIIARKRVRISVPLEHVHMEIHNGAALQFVLDRAPAKNDT